MAPLCTLIVAGFLSLALAVPAELEERFDGLKCTDFKIPVAASAKTFDIGKIPKHLSDPDVLSDFLIASGSGIAGGFAGKLTNGTYMMAGRFCDPITHDPAKENTLFYMQHAITMTKEYWSGLSYPRGFKGAKYSLMHVASEAGYPVVAFDNLGSGASEHPDPVSTVQQTLQVEIIHQIIQKFRHGEVKGPAKGKKFKKVIYAGHSYGSICGNGVATHHPKDVDAFILTGYSGEFDRGGVPLGAGILIPASQVKPHRYGSLNPGYLAMSSEKGREFGLYTNPKKLGGFNPKAPAYDFKHEGTVAIGEIATLLYGVGPANDYEGHILAITGQNDAIACNNVVTNIPHCGYGKDSIPMKAKKFFPKANYEVHIPDLTGHDADIHYSSPKSFKIAMAFLKKAGL